MKEDISFDLAEIKTTVQLAWPVMCTFLLQTSIGLVATMFVGQIGTQELAAASLGTMLGNIMGFSVGIGFSSAMDTLCSQAYGSGNYFMLGTICQRSILILGVLCVPLGSIWIYSEHILIFLGQDPTVSHFTGIYMQYQLIGLWPQFIFSSMNKYLQCQGITKPSMYIVILVSLINPFLTYALIYPLNWGFEGAALSVSICRILLAVFLIIYIKLRGLHYSTWAGWSMDSLRGWGTFLSLGLPGCVMICAEWWAAELLTLAAGWIGTEQLATQAVLGNTSGLFFAIPLSFSIACSIRVGNSLGGNRPHHAKAAWRAAFQFTVLLMTCVMTLLVCIRSVWPVIFTTDMTVMRLVTRYLPVLAQYAVIDTMQIVAAGALKGCGHQRVGAICNLFSYYVIGLPIAFYAAFVLDFGLDGLWLGNSIGNILQASLLVTAVAKINWTREAELARERTACKKPHLTSNLSFMDTLPPTGLTPTASRMFVDPAITTANSNSFEDKQMQNYQPIP